MTRTLAPFPDPDPETAALKRLIFPPDMTPLEQAGSLLLLMGWLQHAQGQAWWEAGDVVLTTTHAIEIGLC
jgi:hypothetical protein